MGSQAASLNGWAHLLQTGLHEAYTPDDDHVCPGPFTDRHRGHRRAHDRPGAPAPNVSVGSPGAAPVHWVPVDLTLPEDGFNRRTAA